MRSQRITENCRCAHGFTADQYKLNSLRYDLSKLRVKALVEKIPRSRRYRLTAEGYRISLIYLKLFHKLYAPLTAGMIHPFAGDRLFPLTRTSTLDQLYLAVGQALDNLIREIGLEVAA